MKKIYKIFLCKNFFSQFFYELIAYLKVIFLMKLDKKLELNNFEI